MDALAQRYAAAGFRFAFIYVREAHPGERTPHHCTLRDKTRGAEQLRARWAVRRPILVDDLDGTVHRVYGALPNMTYIVRRGGRVAYRADWTDAPSVRSAIEYMLQDGRSGRPGSPSTLFYSELLGQRLDHDDEAFMRGLLESGGERAAREFIAAIENRRGAAAGARLRKIRAMLAGDAGRD